MYSANVYNLDTRYTTHIGSNFATDMCALDALCWYVLAAVPSHLRMIVVIQPYGLDVHIIKRRATARKDFCPVKYTHVLRGFIKIERD